jgi:phosphatidylserine/phosphatidylglycerophosphate/cardiolipin synthase-like enzyme
MVPFLEILSDLVDSGVSIRLIHAKEPGPNFRQDFDRYPNLIDGLEQILCPRVHFKSVIVDGTFAYTGSANLTGAGMGAKSENRRNFENGLISHDPGIIAQIAQEFDDVWMRKYCERCGRKEYCAESGDST